MIDIQPDDRAVFDRLKSNGRITQGLRRMMTQQYNVCVSCQKRVPNGRPLFAGYDSDAKPLVVGACCAGRISELATPVYWYDALDLSVPDAQPVWRYMDFAKFVAMLQQGGLYFSRADKLNDPFEGASGLAKRENDWDNFYLKFFREIVVTPPPGYPKPLSSKEEVEEQAQHLLRQIKDITSTARNQLVSCWHANEIESEALWRLYCPPPAPGVAIQSTVGQLWSACADTYEARVGRVQYVDFRKTFALLQSERIFQKRMSLSHEEEVRIVLPNDFKSPLEGTVINCDLSALVSRVVTSPFAPPWFHSVVAGVVAKFGYTLDLRSSELLEQPFY